MNDVLSHSFGQKADMQIQNASVLTEEEEPPTPEEARRCIHSLKNAKASRQDRTPAQTRAVGGTALATVRNVLKTI